MVMLPTPAVTPEPWMLWASKIFFISMLLAAVFGLTGMLPPGRSWILFSIFGILWGAVIEARSELLHRQFPKGVSSTYDPVQAK
jgi:hypothetical protein